MCFFRKKREKKKALQEEQLRMQQESKKKGVFVGGKPAPVKKEEVKIDEKKPVVKEAATVKKAAVKEPVKVEKAETEQDKKNKKYHVSQNKDAKSNYYKQWRVRKEGSSKTIKYHETQAEAIAFAEDLAEKNDTSIVIHKLDGSIRKQEY